MNKPHIRLHFNPPGLWQTRVGREVGAFGARAAMGLSSHELRKQRRRHCFVPFTCRAPS